MSEEANIMKALIEQLRVLNENLSFHNDIILSHFAATGEIELEEQELDS